MRAIACGIPESLTRALEKKSQVPFTWTQSQEELRETVEASCSKYDIIVIGLDDGGEETIRALRQMKQSRKSLILCVWWDPTKRHVERTVKCFRFGADFCADFAFNGHRAEKIVEYMHLVMLTLIRRAKSLSCGQLTFDGCLTVDLDNGRVFLDGKEVPLTKTEWRIFRAIFLSRNALITPENIFAAMSGDGMGCFKNNPDSHILHVYMVHLRKKLRRERDPEFGWKCLQTVWGRGFKWGFPAPPKAR